MEITGSPVPFNQISIAEMWTFLWKKGLYFVGKTEYITHAFY